MEQIFTHPHILTQIVPHCSSSSLASLAQVSQAVSEVALDQLWSGWISIILLARCMPQEMWDEIETCSPGGRRPYYTSQLTLYDQQRTGDWLGQRFRSYAARVKTLSIDRHMANRAKWPIRSPASIEAIQAVTEKNVEEQARFPTAPDLAPRNDHDQVYSSSNSNVIRAWAEYSRDVTPLFPNLKNLYWRVTDSNDLHLIRPFLGPSLQYLDVVSDSSTKPGDSVPHFDGTTLAAILREAVSTSPKFRHLRISLMQREMANFDAVAIAPLQNLVTFTSGYERISNTFIQSAATWRHLQCFTAAAPSHVSLPRSLPRIFPSLRQLRVVQTSLERIEGFISAVQSSSIHTMDIGTTEKLCAEDILQLLQIIAKHPSANSMQHLSFSYHPESRQLGQAQQKRASSLESINYCVPRELENLHTFSLQYGARYSFSHDKNIIRGMLESWPKLRELRIRTVTREEMPLQDFVDITRNRPCLEVIDGLEVMLAGGSMVPELDGWKHPHLKYACFNTRGNDPRENLRAAALDWLLLGWYVLTTFPGLLPLAENTKIFGSYQPPAPMVFRSGNLVMHMVED